MRPRPDAILTARLVINTFNSLISQSFYPKNYPKQREYLVLIALRRNHVAQLLFNLNDGRTVDLSIKAAEIIHRELIR